MKHIIAVFGLLIIMAFAVQHVMAQGTVEVPQIQIGTFSTTGTNLADGMGDRQLTVAISFPKPFKVKPDVIVALTMIDADAMKSNVRVVVKADGISRDGFTAVVRTYADSKVYAVQGSWVAVAPTTVKAKP